MRTKTVTRIVIYVLILGGFYYLYSLVGVLDGFINYGGPANQLLALLLALASLGLVIRYKVIRWR